MTQEEILAEAARTELDNLRDLEQMVAMEEATKQKAMYKRNKYSGPMIRYHSKRVEGVALVGAYSCIILFSSFLCILSLHSDHFI